MVNSEAVRIPSTRANLNSRVNHGRNELRDPIKTVSFHPATPGGSVRANFPPYSSQPASLPSPIPPHQPLTPHQNASNFEKPNKLKIRQPPKVKENSNPAARDLWDLWARPRERVDIKQPGIREYTRVGKKRFDAVVSTVQNTSKNSARPIEKKNRTSGLTFMSGKPEQYKPTNLDFSSESELDEAYRLPAPGNTDSRPALMPPVQEDSANSERDSARERNRRGNFSSDSYHSNRAEDVIEAVCGQLALARLPIPEPDVFDGKNPLSYSAWQLSFDALVNHRALTATDKLALLNKFVGGEAKAAIEGYLMMPPQEAYEEAYALLASRYGDPLNIANAYKERLRAWPRIAGSDSTGLRKFTDYLKQCRTAKRSFRGLRVLDDEPENIEMMRKLPPWLSRKWAGKAAAHRKATGEIPSFESFTEFVIEEEEMSSDPVYKALYKQENLKSKRTSFVAESQSFSFATDSRAMTPDGKISALVCSVLKDTL